MNIIQHPPSLLKLKIIKKIPLKSMQPATIAPKNFPLRAGRRAPAFDLTRAPKTEATPLYIINIIFHLLSKAPVTPVPDGGAAGEVTKNNDSSNCSYNKIYKNKERRQ